MGKQRHTPTEQLGMHAVEEVFIQIGWIKRPQYECDMGIDLHVEVCEVGTPTGRLLAVQVKSGESYWKEINDNRLVFRFDGVHYSYWVNHSLPVLLAFFHPQTKKVIWQHISPSTCTSTGAGWKTEIPLAQELTQNSVGELSLLARKPTLLDAVAAEKERLEKLDPRFRVCIAVSPDGEVHNFFDAVEDVQITFKVMGTPETVEAKYRDLIEKGKPATFGSDELRIAGSPLFDRWEENQNGKVTIQAALKMSTTLSLVAMSVFEDEKARIDSIPATITAGTKCFVISGRLGSSPLSINIEGSRIAAERKGKVSIDFASKDWEGKPLLQLPYFDQIRRLFRALGQDAKCVVECCEEGNKIASISGDINGSKIKPWINIVEFLNKARFVAKRLNLHPILPDLTSEQESEVETLYTLLSEGEVATDLSSFKLTMKQLIAPQHLTGFPDAFLADTPFQIAKWEEQPQSMPFLGENVEVGSMLYGATSVLLSNRERVRRKLRSCRSGEELNLVFKGTRGCRLIRKIKPMGDRPHRCGQEETDR